MQLEAPAKINLSIRILGRRDDGFHEVETLMAPISLSDRLTITPTESGVMIFECDDPTLPGGDDNLVVKAAKLFLAAAGIEDGFAIQLEKRIPHGAGLGGGSSDAAAVLRALNHLLSNPLGQQRLYELATHIGSDVPFFIAGSAANCRGRGELIEPVRIGRSLPLLLLKPSFGVATPWAYSRWRDAAELPGVSYAAQEFDSFKFVNDLERPVFEKYPFLAHAKMWLLDQPEVGAALMSGSGSTMLAVLRDAADAEALGLRARRELDAELWACGCATRDLAGDTSLAV
jgi:4-diphosphocytidyl-2-C-methyl-D-erythritol kinase